ncbi:MAG: UTP--glucose-1-phosphate uridylyltransferase [Candidatus Methanomethylicia archaeon]
MRKAVITAAGLGTRLLLATKEMPKEMLPLFCSGQGVDLLLKPVLQLIFEQLYDLGFREFCFVVGRGKRSIEDHFTPDYNYIELLKGKNKVNLVKNLEEFYQKVEKSIIFWVNQPEPRGFGHAVLMAEPFIGQEPFLVHAGDTYIVSENYSPIKRLLDHYAFRKPHAALILKEVHDHQKIYGCAVAKEIEKEILKVEYVVEKPEEPPSNLAIMPIYIFDPVIFRALKQTGPGVGGEIQLTDAIQKLIEWGMRVEAIKLREDDVRLDVGTPETYWEALNISYLRLSRGRVHHE